jgi:hypothetical protein
LRTDGSLWATFPFALLAFVAPAWAARTRPLWLLAGIPLVGVVLTAPNDGGAQWGPRYLLIIVPPLLLLALDAAVRLLARRGTARWLGAAVTAVAVVAGLATTRSAYRELRGSKRLHAELSRDVASLHQRYVITDLWWLDQLAAAAEPRPTFLFVRDRAELETVLTMLGQARVDHFATVRGPESPDSTWAGSWPGRYVATREQRIAVRDLRATRYDRPK